MPMKDKYSKNSKPEEPQFPMRINKYLAMEGRGSRRDMDEVIRKGKVLINGRRAVLGDKVNEGDKIEIEFKGGIREQKQPKEE
jgi:16S rRNA U516 pseudouridylate synthase RsuA-like enzyme